MHKNYIYEDGLTTKRLSTRFLNMDDRLIWIDFFKDKEAVELLPNFGLTTPEERANHWINRQLNRYATKQFGLQALLDKNTKAFIGQCGLIQQEVDGKIEIEVGYHILKKYWGQGFAHEAANYLLITHLIMI